MINLPKVILYDFKFYFNIYFIPFNLKFIHLVENLLEMKSINNKINYYKEFFNHCGVV